MRKAIAVYCGSSTDLSEPYHDAANIIGKGIAANKQTLVYGGGRIGLMGEVASSAAASGAQVVGVITHKLVKHEQANESCDELIVVDTMQERRTIMMERSRRNTLAIFLTHLRVPNHMCHEISLEDTV